MARDEYAPLHDKVARALQPRDWSAEIGCFKIGVSGSYAEPRWTAARTALEAFWADLAPGMAALASQCLPSSACYHW